MKMYRIFTGIFIVAVVILLSLIGYNKYKFDSQKLKNLQSKNRIENKRNEIGNLKKQIEEIAVNMDKELNRKNTLEELNKKLPQYKERNEFIKKLSENVGKYSIVQRTNFSHNEKEKTLTIDIALSGDYETVRKLIYDIEKSYYFTSIEDIMLQNSKNLIKGSLKIKAFFGDEVYE